MLFNITFFHDFPNYFFDIICLVVFREESEGKLKGILGYTEDDVVSTDFVGDSRYRLIFRLVCLEIFLAMHLEGRLFPQDARDKVGFDVD